MKNQSADKTGCAVLSVVEASIFENLSRKQKIMNKEKITGAGDVSAFAFFGLMGKCYSLFCSNINHHCKRNSNPAGVSTCCHTMAGQMISIRYVFAYECIAATSAE